MAKISRMGRWAWGFGCVLGAAWAGVSPASGQVRNPDTLIYAHTGEITSLDPAIPYDLVSQGLLYNIYEPLIDFERESLERFVPVLAEKVPSVANGLVSKDGLTYTFPIRKGVRFHDGTPLAAEDVRYSLLRFMLVDRAGGPSSLLLEPILGIASTRDAGGKIQVRSEDVKKAVRVQGDKVVVRLRRPFAPFLSILARWSFVVSKKWAAEHGDWDGSTETWEKHNNPEKTASYLFDHANGTAPFELERWDPRSKRVYLRRFAGYRGKPAALARIGFMTVDEFSTRKLMLQAGDADIIDVPRSMVPQLEGLEGVRVYDRLPRLMTDPVLFFTFKVNAQANADLGSGALDGNGIPPNFFSDPDIRKAFAFSFDYDAFLKESFRGKAVRAKGAIPPGLPGSDPEQKFYTYDREKAARHFKRAWGGKVWEKGFRFTLTYNLGGEMRELACRVLKKNVEELNPNFRIDLRGVDWAAFLDKTQNRKMPIFARGWTADYPDAHNFVFPFYHSQGRYAIAQGYAHPTMDKLVETAVRETSLTRRKLLYKRIQELAFDEAPHVYTVHPEGVTAMRDWLKGYYDNPVSAGIPFCYPLKKG